jgi:uncharacterized membrane protein YfcA
MGVSGAVLFVPFYTIIFPLLGYHVSPVQAVQLGLITELFGFMSSTTAFWRRKLIDFNVAGFALLFAVPTAVLGSYVANLLPGSWLLFITGVALLSFSLLLLKESAVEHEAESRSSQSTVRKEKTSLQVHADRQGRVYRYSRNNDARRGIIAGLGGLFQGLVGFSAGEFNTIDLVLRSAPVRIATGSAHLIIAGATLAAAGAHIAIVVHDRSTIPWPILAASIPGVLIGGQLAGLIAGRLPQEVLQGIMARFLMFISLVSLYRSALNAGYHLPVWLLLGALPLFLGSIVPVLKKRSHPVTVRVRCACGSVCDTLQSEEKHEPSEYERQPVMEELVGLDAVGGESYSS